MVERTPEEDLKLCRRVMKEEFADLQFTGKYSTRKLVKTTGLNVCQKKLCITQLEGLEVTFIPQNWLSLSCCRGTK